MGHIFISYSHKDSSYVHKLAETLEEEGFEVWIDDRIDYGTTWPTIIQRNLDDCSAFIVVMTENAYESKWVHNEVTRADRKRKPFFALLLSGDTWLSLEAIQYEDVVGGKLPSRKFYESLARVITRKVKVQTEKDKRKNDQRAMHSTTIHDSIDKARREKTEPRTAQIVKLRESLYKSFLNLKSKLPKRFTFLRIAGFAGLTLMVLWVSSLGVFNTASLFPTARASQTPTHPQNVTFTANAQSYLTPTKTSTPRIVASPSLTPTQSFTSTFKPSSTVLATPTNVGGELARIIFVSKGSNKSSVYAVKSDGTDLTKLTESLGNTDTPLWSPNNDKIIFVSDSTGHKEIYAMNEDGSDKISLTAAGCESWDPAWSPDGAQIVYISNCISGRHQIFIMNKDGSEKMSLATTFGSFDSPSFSPDGSKIAFIVYPNYNRGYVTSMYYDVINTMGELHSHASFGRSPTASVHVWGFSWLPNSTKIAFVARQEGYQVLLEDIENQADSVRLSSEYEDAIHPSVSPDGVKVAFNYISYGTRGVCWTSIFDSNFPYGETCVSSPPSDVYSPVSWSPDSTQLAFPCEANTNICIVNITTRDLTTLFKTPGNYSDISWAPK